MQGTLILLSILSLFIASGYCLIVTSRRFILHLVVIVSFVIRGVGLVFKFFHWTGTDELLLISYAGFVLGGFLLIWTSLKNPSGKLLHYHLIAGILIAFTVINSFVPVPALDDITRFFAYPLAALSGTILLRQLYVHQGEKNMLNMYFIFAIIAVIIDVSRLV